MHDVNLYGHLCEDAQSNVPGSTVLSVHLEVMGPRTAAGKNPRCAFLREVLPRHWERKVLESVLEVEHVFTLATVWVVLGSAM